MAHHPSSESPLGKWANDPNNNAAVTAPQIALAMERVYDENGTSTAYHRLSEEDLKELKKYKRHPKINADDSK